MRLFIAEKPSLAQAIAHGLGHMSKRNGYIECGNDIVTWCFGHILQQYDPEDYDKNLHAWRLEDLPIIPEHWKNKVSSSAKEQYEVIKSLVAKADCIVNAGDPDREGQLLVDEVLNQLGVLNQKPIQRILLNALDEKSVKTALVDIRDNRDFVGLRNSALARQRADWLIGMNLTRMYTIRSQKAGYTGTISVGRVQTPTTALVVRRELEIRNFKPKDYYLLQVDWAHPNGVISTTWKPQEQADRQDEEGRLIKRDPAEQLAEEIRQETGVVESVEQKKGQSQPKLPYSLSSLQIDAGKIYGYSPQEVLDTQQSLYEKKLTTYPRSDCDYLPTNQLADVPLVLKSLRALTDDLAQMVESADPALRSRAWNDKKISAHHAIIPTTITPEWEKLTEKEQNLYILAAKAYLAQFYPPQTFLSTKIQIRCAGESFHASGKVILDDGWKQLYHGSLEEKEGDDHPETKLPAVKQGDAVSFQESRLQTRTTKPPARYNASTLLKAMKEIGKYVKDASLKATLKDCSGIGTEATRAGIIETIQKRGFVSVTRQKNLIPTEKGYLLLRILSDSITYPDITARWEQSLDAISRKEMRLQDFFQEQSRFVQQLLEEAKSCEIPPPKDVVRCPKCSSPMMRRWTTKNGKKSYFWGCSKYPECKTTLPDRNGKPVFEEMGYHLKKKQGKMNAGSFRYKKPTE